jgi:putative ABC transport system permease protein
VLGSTAGEIIKLLYKDLLILVGIGFLISVPVAYPLAGYWLQSFTFRIDIGAGMFILSGVLAMLIAAAAVSYQSIRAARMNPVECLRSE